MSKIPQGEWSAIAARYAKGESISKITQTYGCAPPAIHYILKRSKQRGAQNTGQRVNGRPEPVASLVSEPRPAPVPEPPPRRMSLEKSPSDRNRSRKAPTLFWK